MGKPEIYDVTVLTADFDSDQERTWSGDIDWEKKKVRAIRCGYFFCFHKSVHTKDKSDAWTVTHIPSGLAIGKVSHPVRAKRLCEYLEGAEEIDWNFPAEDIDVEREFRINIREATEAMERGDARSVKTMKKRWPI